MKAYELLGAISIGGLVGVAALLFGSSKLPKLARSVGQASGELQKGKQQAEQELNEMRNDINDEEGEPVDG
ncbi:twin-arginine translocase TatA/TatE family subunit [Natronococcus sp. A-GB1]|uniref:twin-arginine translocase TatA/TatE family subunit n=1 Tax=Natronococcus sp. A-GB1 TaxID=3037648 RepID=UPI00241DE44D|nr:twin-arginine translocase TatA/TatE family subunit [Natronococcus sp. A-GB1]MDG5758847.1 twin-arginine translocase TatA/TatE family subunit [Natronococcus sp. A-GB1]